MAARADRYAGLGLLTVPGPRYPSRVDGSRVNWAGNVRFGAREIVAPTSVAELQAVVARADRVRALGTRHSFNEIADSPGVLVSTAALPPAVDVDRAGGTARVAAGLRYAEVAVRLDAQGLALPNLGSLPHLSVAGACATGTHGSGTRNGCLATSVAGLELVTAGGDIVVLHREDEDLAGAVVALGALGVVVAVTLDVVPAFDVGQVVHEWLDHDVLVAHLDEVMGSGYSVSAFTDWGPARRAQVWVKQRVGEPASAVLDTPWFPPPADGPRHPVAGMSPVNCSEQLGLPGSWHERLPHFRSGFTPSTGQELQSEYLVARADAPAALRALDGVRDRITAVLQISELRAVAADDLWLSPAQGRDTVAIHFTWIADAGAVLPLVALVEQRLAPFAARPHWGKIFTIDPQVVRSRYELLPRFRGLVQRYDPGGRFANDYTDRYLVGS